MSYNPNLRRIFIAFIAVFSTSFLAVAQNNVGIGTSSPNPNAVLDLISPNANQGLLIPRLTTEQRSSASFVEGLSDEENSLLVFDADESVFYFWSSGSWVPLSTQTISSGNGLRIVDDLIENIGDLDSTNEIQDLSLTGNTLKITLNDGATEIDLSAYFDNTDSQQLSFDGQNLSISGGNTLDISSLSDGTGTDDQNLSEVLTEGANAGGAVISNLGSPTAAGDAATKEYVDQGIASLDVNDDDADVTNELQDLNLDGNTLTITGLTTPTEIDLSPFAGANTDNQTIDALSLNSGVLNISLSGDGEANQTLDLTSLTDDADADPGNEFQTLTQAGATVTLSDGGGSISVEDGDASTTNEIQDLSITGNDLTITGNGSATTIDLSGYLDNTDNQIIDALSLNSGVLNISLSGDGEANQTLDLTSLTDDADADPGNEFQTLTQAGTTVTLSDGGGSISVEDGDASTTNEIQDLSIIGNDLTITGNGSATTIDLSGYLDNTDNQTIDALSLNSGVINISLSGDGQANQTLDLSSLINDADADASNEFQTLAQAGTTVTLSDGGGSISVEDGDASATNEIQDLDLSNGRLSITNNASATEIDLTPLFDNTDEQTLSLSSNNLSISGGNSVSLAAYLDDTDTKLTETEVDAFVSNNGYLTSVPERTDFLVVTPVDFKALQPASGSVDFGVGIGITAEQTNGPYAYLTVTEQTTGTMTSGLKLPNGASIKEIRAMTVNSSNVDAGVSIYKQPYVNGEKPTEITETRIVAKANEGLNEQTINVDYRVNTDPSDGQGGLYYLYFTSLGSTSRNFEAAVFRVIITYTY
jgi:hypothetical protein